MQGSQRYVTHLLPQPREVEPADGVCHLGTITLAGPPSPDPRVSRAAERWAERAASGHQSEPGPGGASATELRVLTDRPTVDHDQGYRLSVRPGCVEVLGGSAAGCFYGLQTLEQLCEAARSLGRRGILPCCTVVDRPDFVTRGLLHDVTRGKVPTLDTLKLLADRLAGMKVNQLQLYIEHAFAFSFDPEVCAPDVGLTPDEVRELDDYCRERFIELIPAVATLGHMGRILSMPKYRHLAEIEATRAWEEMSWPERVRGLTLDCVAKEALGLVEHVWSDILDCFSSTTVNICGDEPWDLGQGKNSDRLPASGRGEVYLERIRATQAFCAARGRHSQCWSDVLRNYPELLDRLPRDLTILHWGYDDASDYEATRAFREAGLDTFVCPGTSGWKRCINAIDAAERNIAAFARAGREHEANGLLNTDWGDHGHFNLLACSWHGIATGAARAWRADHPGGREFDDAFARVVRGMSDAEAVATLRRATAVAAKAETWRQLWMRLRTVADDATLPTIESARESAESARQAMRLIESGRENGGEAPYPQTESDARELTTACRFQQLWAEKVAFARDMRAGRATPAGDARWAWAEQLRDVGVDYEECWLRRNRPSGLSDIRKALTRAARDVAGEEPWDERNER